MNLSSRIPGINNTTYSSLPMDWIGRGKVEYAALRATIKGGQSYWIHFSSTLPCTCISGQTGTVFDEDTMKLLINNLERMTEGFLSALHATERV